MIHEFVTLHSIPDYEKDEDNTLVRKPAEPLPPYPSPPDR
jgi:hypothetical protein